MDLNVSKLTPDVLVSNNIVTAAPHVVMTSQTCWRLLELLRRYKYKGRSWFVNIAYY